MSVRDWLISQTMPGEPPASSVTPLADRLAELERKVEELLVASSTRRQRSPAAATPLPPPLLPADTPAEGVETADLARRLGLKRQAFNARVARAGGGGVALPWGVSAPCRLWRPPSRPLGT
jgi:hypothetical protein